MKFKNFLQKSYTLLGEVSEPPGSGEQGQPKNPQQNVDQGDELPGAGQPSDKQMQVQTQTMMSEFLANYGKIASFIKKEMEAGAKLSSNMEQLVDAISGGVTQGNLVAGLQEVGKAIETAESTYTKTS